MKVYEMEIIKSEPLSDEDYEPADTEDLVMKIECEETKLQAHDFEFIDDSTLRLEEVKTDENEIPKYLPKSILDNANVNLEAVKREMARNPNFRSLLKNAPHNKSVDKKFICDVCNKNFNNDYNLRVHYRIHTKNKPHECNVCGKRFLQHNTLKMHTILHNGEKPLSPHSCDICGKTFELEDELHKHFLLHTRIPVRPYNVNKSSVCLSHLRDHAYTLSPDRRLYRCEVCSKAFENLPGWQAHQRVHKSRK